MIPALLLQAAAAAPCPAQPVIPAELAGWNRRQFASAARNGETTLSSTISVGVGWSVSLLPNAVVRLPARTPKDVPPRLASGVVAFTVSTAGHYRVALGTGAWIDVVRDGKPLASVAHGHGPACSPVRKMVDFDLQPGRHLLQIVGSPVATLDVMIARLP